MANIVRKFKKRFQRNRGARGADFHDVVDQAASFGIEREDLKIGKLIAKGSYGNVYKGSIRKSNKPVAIKVLKDTDCPLLDLYFVYRQLGCNHIVQLIGCIMDPPLLLVMEPMALGDLKTFLRSLNPENKKPTTRQRLSNQQMLQMAGEIADGMAYLHDRNILHEDLAARNCFVSEDMTVKIGGHLELSRGPMFTRTRLYGQRYLFPIRWMSPEDLISFKCSFEGNIWTYGVVLWEIATYGKHPYQELSNEEVRIRLESGHAMDIPETDDKLCTLMRMCWTLDVTQRPTFNDILKVLLPDMSPKFHEVSFFNANELKVPSEIEHDPYALNLYIKALKDGKEEDRSIRINVVGNFAQGKTSLIRRLVGESIEDVESTNGIDVDRYSCQKGSDSTFTFLKRGIQDTTDISKRLVEVACSDTGNGDKMFGNAEQINARDGRKSASTEILDVQSMWASSDMTETEMDRTDAQQKFSQNTVKQSNGQNSNAESQNSKFLTEEDYRVFEKQFKNSNNTKRETRNPVSFDIWDFGGQYTFYATHTIFHSRKAIYVLVCNLALDLHKQLEDENNEGDESCLSSKNKDMEYFIRFWMNSIHSFVGNDAGTEPTVILVGTHKDKLEGDNGTKQKLADKYFSDVRDLFDGTQVINHIQREEYAVDNTDESDESIKKLRE